ncbi:MAG: hypothetical protein ABJM58_09980 [Alteripontixanthobacter sp.]
MNEASLQGQFGDVEQIRDTFRELIKLRGRNRQLKNNLHVTRMLPQAPVTPDTDVRMLVAQDRDLRSSLMRWLDSTGPFVEDDRAEEADDYFECQGIEVTASGLGEAARRIKRGEACSSFSFAGGENDFALSPLEVLHGLPEEPLGWYAICNLWQIAELESHACAAQKEVATWQELTQLAKERFQNLEVANLHLDTRLAREPFEAPIATSALELLALLNEYVGDRAESGDEGPRSREIVEQFFSGENARFSPESETNRKKFKQAMTFARDDGTEVLADHHGKIRRRFFRMHFEWPLEGGRSKLGVFYLGPKLTKG